MAPADDPRAALEACFADLAENKPADAVLTRLRALEPALRDDAPTRARFLRARAIATNRLGFGGEALGDLHEARRLLEAGGHAKELGEIFQAIATVFRRRRCSGMRWRSAPRCRSANISAPGSTCFRLPSRRNTSNARARNSPCSMRRSPAHPRGC
jgi:hypothetical protein